MIPIFLLSSIVLAQAIHKTGAWLDESSRIHDLLGFILLGLSMATIAMLLAPFEGPPGPPPCYNCIIIPLT